MARQRVSGFFLLLGQTPAFVFLCAMFLCGALVGSLTGLAAEQGEDALRVAEMLEETAKSPWRGAISAVLLQSLPLLCALLRPKELFLSAFCAMRGFGCALCAAAGTLAGDGILRVTVVIGLPCVLSVPALLAACACVWHHPGSAGTERLAYLLCIVAAAAAALLRSGLAAWLL